MVPRGSVGGDKPLILLGKEAVWHWGSAQGLDLSRLRIPEGRGLTIPGVFREGFFQGKNNFTRPIIPLTSSAADNPI